MHGTIAFARNVLPADRRPEETADSPGTRGPLHAHLPQTPQRGASRTLRGRRPNTHVGDHARGMYMYMFVVWTLHDLMVPLWFMARSVLDGTENKRLFYHR